MANEGVFPKSDGWVFYASEANSIYDAPKVATGQFSNTSITTSATLIVGAVSTRKELLIENCGTAAVYLGTSGTTTTIGYPLLPGYTLALRRLDSPDAWYGIVATGTADVRFSTLG